MTLSVCYDYVLYAPPFPDRLLVVHSCVGIVVFLFYFFLL